MEPKFKLHLNLLTQSQAMSRFVREAISLRDVVIYLSRLRHGKLLVVGRRANLAQ